MRFFLLGIMLVYCLQLSPAAAERNEFYFVQITDTHWGDGDNIGRTKRVVEAINGLPMPVEFVAHTGDLAQGAMENGPFADSVCAMMRTCKYPVFYCAGNHDILGGRFSETSAAFVRRFGSLSRRVEAHGVSLVTLFNFLVPGDTGPKLLNDPIRQLDSLLQGKPAGMPAIVFQHDPTVEDFYNNAIHDGWPAERLAKFQKLCEAGGVVAVISGHFHRDELHWIGRIPLFVSGPVAGKKGRQATFRVYHYESGTLSYFTQYVK
jgi:3',5'-cyclic AMP phosphodiesterase CpdA